MPLCRAVPRLSASATPAGVLQPAYGSTGACLLVNLQKRSAATRGWLPYTRNAATVRYASSRRRPPSRRIIAPLKRRCRSPLTTIRHCIPAADDQRLSGNCHAFTTWRSGYTRWIRHQQRILRAVLPSSFFLREQTTYLKVTHAFHMSLFYTPAKSPPSAFSSYRPAMLRSIRQQPVTVTPRYAGDTQNRY